LHRDARAAEIELVRYPRRQEILVVLQEQVELLEIESRSHECVLAVVRRQVVQQVTAGGAGSVDADRAVEQRGVTAGVFEGMPCALQEQPVLGIQRPSELRREPEEFGVELVDAVDDRRAPHICRVRQHLVADPGGPQLVLGKGGDRLFAAPKVVPERRHAVGARESACHADYRNGVVRLRL
jgi:hypothetical protein